VLAATDTSAAPFVPLVIRAFSVLSAVNILLDESGSFVSGASQNSWNCIAAYLTPEVDRKRLRRL
jgi:hypothetical protein